MSMAAAFDSSRLGIKGKERREILEKSYQKKYKTIENHINILKEEIDVIDLDYIKRIHFLLSSKESRNAGNFRTLNRYRRFPSGKLLCSTKVEEDMEKLVSFINDESFSKYTLVNIAITQLAILSLSPFDKINRFVSITIADKLMQKHYGKPIFMETVLYRVGSHAVETMELVRRF
jgi:Fic family protein